MIRHTQNRKNAASCLWAYHDARRELEYHVKCNMFLTTFQVAEYQQTMNDALRQYQDYKYRK